MMAIIQQASTMESGNCHSVAVLSFRLFKFLRHHGVQSMLQSHSRDRWLAKSNGFHDGYDSWLLLPGSSSRASRNSTRMAKLQF